MSGKRNLTFMYKCRLCDTISGNVGGTMTSELANRRLSEVMDWGLLKAEDVTVRNYSLHDCKNGNIGVADLVGVVHVPE